MACHNLMMPSSRNGEIPRDQKAVLWAKAPCPPFSFFSGPCQPFSLTFPSVLAGLTLSVATFFFTYIDTFSLASSDGLHTFLLGYYVLILSWALGGSSSCILLEIGRARAGGRGEGEAPQDAGLNPRIPHHDLSQRQPHNPTEPRQVPLSG